MVTIATNMAGRGTDIKLSPEVKAAGGLAIIGTERHESRRMDRQLRGWQAVDDLVQPWNPQDGQVCRVLVGMQRPPHDEIRALYNHASDEGLIDNATASRLKMQFAAHLREQITLGIPTGQDEAGLRRLARQLRNGQVVVKLFLPYPLHAKLYLFLS